MATNFDYLCIADSRGVGIGDPASFDYLAMPDGTNFGANYTTGTASLSGGNGTGAVIAADVFRNGDGTPNANKALVTGIRSRGKGYTGTLPTITITGDGTGAAFVNRAGGGYIVPLEQKLQARGLLINIIPAAKSGARISAMYPGSPTPGVEWTQAKIAIGTSTNFAVDLDIGFNDAVAGETGAAWQSELTAFCTYWLAQGAKAIFVHKPFGSDPAYTNASAINALVQAYGTAVDAVISANPTKVFLGASEYPFPANNAGFLTSDMIHPGASGNAVLASAKDTALYQELTTLFGDGAAAPPATDPYRSDNATPVTILADYKPGAPNPFAGTGLGTFLLPTVVLTWINPANLLGGTIHIMRMNAGTSDPFVVVGTVAGADANTAPAQTYTDTTVLNGHRYTYTAFATPYGDTTTP